MTPRQTKWFTGQILIGLLSEKVIYLFVIVKIKSKDEREKKIVLFCLALYKITNIKIFFYEK